MNKIDIIHKPKRLTHTYTYTHRHTLTHLRAALRHVYRRVKNMLESKTMRCGNLQRKKYKLEWWKCNRFVGIKIMDRTRTAECAASCSINDNDFYSHLRWITETENWVITVLELIHMMTQSLTHLFLYSKMFCSLSCVVNAHLGIASHTSIAIHSHHFSVWSLRRSERC